MITRSLMFGLAAGLALALVAAGAASLTGLSIAPSIPVILTLAVIVTLSHHWKTQLFETLRQEFRHVVHRLAQLEEHVREAQGLAQLTPYERPYPLPFGGGWALTADAAALLVREVALHRPQTIVELGSGVSTLLLARLLKEMGTGKVYSLDHDAGWAERTRQHLRASNVSDMAEVFDAPLSRQHFGGETYDWYTVPEAVNRLERIDFLIVDGPPAALDPQGMPRYPALPAFLAKLSANATIYVDDAKRPQEQAMIQRWLKEHPQFEGHMHDTVPGTYLLTRKG